MSKRFWKGIFEENPVLVLMLGLCPALGTTTAVKRWESQLRLF